MSNRLCYVRYTGSNATDFCDYTSRIFGEFTGIGVVMDRTGMDVPDKDMSKYMNVQNGKPIVGWSTPFSYSVFNKGDYCVNRKQVTMPPLSKHVSLSMLNKLEDVHALQDGRVYVTSDRGRKALVELATRYKESRFSDLKVSRRWTDEGSSLWLEGKVDGKAVISERVSEKEGAQAMKGTDRLNALAFRYFGQYLQFPAEQEQKMSY